MLSRKNRGFTLIELLVVISIIGLLSSIILGSLNTARQKAEDSKQIQALTQLKQAMELYREDNNDLYPDLPVANPGYRINSWDSPSFITIMYDASRLSALAPYLAIRPSGNSNVLEGYYYQVSTNRKDYKITLAGTINDMSIVPQSMQDVWFNDLETVASVWSSDAAKTWVWYHLGK